MPRQQSVILNDTEDKEKKAKLMTALKQERVRLDDLNRDREDEIRTHAKNLKHYDKELAKTNERIAKLSRELGIEQCLEDTHSSPETLTTRLVDGMTSSGSTTA